MISTHTTHEIWSEHDNCLSDYEGELDMDCVKTSCDERWVSVTEHEKEIERMRDDFVEILELGKLTQDMIDGFKKEYSFFGSVSKEASR